MVNEEPVPSVEDVVRKNADRACETGLDAGVEDALAVGERADHGLAILRGGPQPSPKNGFASSTHGEDAGVHFSRPGARVGVVAVLGGDECYGPAKVRSEDVGERVRRVVNDGVGVDVDDVFECFQEPERGFDFGEIDGEIVSEGGIEDAERVPVLGSVVCVDFFGVLGEGFDFGGGDHEDANRLRANDRKWGRGEFTCRGERFKGLMKCKCETDNGENENEKKKENEHT